MKKKEIDHFFHQLSSKTKIRAQIYLTGGIASLFLGGNRATQDIDFAVLAKKNWEEISRSIIEVSQKLAIPVEFTEDISRWGMIGFPEFERDAIFYKNFGSIKVYILDPIIWSVGKMSRYTLDDLQDIEKVFKKNKVTPDKVIKIWAEAFLKSPNSSEKNLFIKKVEDFLKHSGQAIWGKKLPVDQTFNSFLRLVQLKKLSKT